MAGDTGERKPEGSGRGRSFVRRERPKIARRKDLAAAEPAPSSTTGRPAHPAREREEHSRVIIPRHERGAGPPSGLEIELREVREGLKPGDRYLRVVPSAQKLRGVAPGHIEATVAGSQPLGRIQRLQAAVKRVVIGSPLAASRLLDERLSKLMALPIFSSDALSSSAYATEEIFLILILAGSMSLDVALPIVAVIVGLLAIVTISYRQTVRFYPTGGGAYSVAEANLGQYAGLLAAAALSVGYVLTVSVSVAAGVAAVTSAVPDLYDMRVPLCLAVTLVLTLINLRGVREAGMLFATPTYFFITAMTTLIGVGFIKVVIGDAPGTITEAARPNEFVPPVEALSAVIILRAFAAGCAGLTGVEAISNGVPAFKPPESTNARTTLAIMAAILGFMLLGVTFLATRYGLVPVEDETLVSDLGRRVLGDNVLYYGLQVATALVLFLAANTSYAGFPLMAAILAQDRYLPRQLAFRGDRLAYSNGILLLSAAAAALMVAFDAQVSRLVPLYALGVFISFTLSQSGMVRHLLRDKAPGWRGAVLISGVGALVTGLVAVVVGSTRFVDGAWISMVMMAALIALFLAIRAHYRWFERQVAVPEGLAPVQAPAAATVEAAVPKEHVIVPVDGVNKIALAAVSMATEISPLVTAVHLADDRRAAEEFRAKWQEAAPGVPLMIIESPYRQFVAPMIAYIDMLERTERNLRRVTVVLPSFVARHWWERLLHNRDVLRLRPFLKERENVRVIDFPYSLEREGAGGGPASAPSAA